MKFRSVVSLAMLVAIIFVLSNVAIGQENEPEIIPAEVSAPLAFDSSFTYQGRLDDSSGPVNDSCDFRFSLWDAVSGGSQVGGFHKVTNVTVTEGNFTVEVNTANQFGGNAFNGNNRWLRIEARCPTGSSSFTTLTPRQEITAAPYAYHARTAPWSGLSGAPWAFFSGSGTSGELYRSGDVALGAFTDPDGHSLNVQNYAGGKAAVRGADQLGSTIYAEGQLGVLGYPGLPLSVTNVGVLGLKPAFGNNGAAVFGWNSDNNSNNYGGVFVANGTGTNNYGIYATASGASTNNLAGYFGGRVGINTTAPTADIHILQSDGISFGAGGIRFEISGGTNWKILHTGAHLSFAENGTRLAYVQSGTGTYVVTSDRALKENVAPLGGVLNGVMQLKPVTYSYITDPKSTRVNGFIAQDVEAVFPELVKTDEEGNKGLSYSDFGVLAMAAIQEQQALIATLQQENAGLRAEIEAIKNQAGAGSDTIIAQNGGGTVLEVGDLVVANGIIPPQSEGGRPTLVVSGAAGGSSGGRFIGVVETASPAGEMVTIRVRGMAQVKVDASAGAIQAGDAIVASTSTAFSPALRASDSGSGEAVIGSALEPLGNGSGLIWVLVDFGQ